MYIMHKIVCWVLSPFGIFFIGLGVSWLVGRKSKLWARILVGALIAFMWLMSCNVMTRIIGVPLEGEEVPFAQADQVGDIDAVVILGGGADIHKSCGRVELFDAADRVWKGASLWNACNRPELKFVLGGQTDENILVLLKDFGIPADVVSIYKDARTTQEEAKLIAESGVKKIALVTSAWHMPRAKRLFERAGFEIVPAPCDYEMHWAAEHTLSVNDFIPRADCGPFVRNSVALKEWIARIAYWTF